MRIELRRIWECWGDPFVVKLPLLQTQETTAYPVWVSPARQLWLRLVDLNIVKCTVEGIDAEIYSCKVAATYLVFVVERVVFYSFEGLNRHIVMLGVH